MTGVLSWWSPVFEIGEPNRSVVVYNGRTGEISPGLTACCHPADGPP